MSWLLKKVLKPEFIGPDYELKPGETIIVRDKNGRLSQQRKRSTQSRRRAENVGYPINFPPPPPPPPAPAHASHRLDYAEGVYPLSRSRDRDHGSASSGSSASSRRAVPPLAFDVSPRDVEADRGARNHRRGQSAASYSSSGRSFAPPVNPPRGPSSVQSGLRDRRYEGGSDNSSQRQHRGVEKWNCADTVVSASCPRPPPSEYLGSGKRDDLASVASAGSYHRRGRRH